MTSLQIKAPVEIPVTEGGSRGGAVIFTALGLGVLALYLLYYTGYFELPREMHNFPVEVVCGMVALLLFFMGLPGFFRRRFIRIDPFDRTVQYVRAGLVTVRLDEKIPFDNLTHVQIDLYTGSSSSRKSRRSYPVFIHLKGGERKRIFISDLYQRARNCGEQVAKAANVNLHDDSERGDTQIRSPEQLDQTVREKLGKEFVRRAAPQAPSVLHSRLKPKAQELVIDIPRINIASLGQLQAVLWIILLVFGAWAAVALYFNQIIFALFGAFVCGAFCLLVFHSETVTVSRDALTLRSGFFFLKISRTIPLSELEELTLVNATKHEKIETDQLLESGQISKEMHAGIRTLAALGSAIVARSDLRSFSFGRILSAPELDYLLYEIEQRIRR